MEVPGSASGVYIFECIASEASTANPLKKRAFRRPMDQVSIFKYPSMDLKVGFLRTVIELKIIFIHIFSLWTTTTHERSATCSSIARMAARLSTTTFRSSLMLHNYFTGCLLKLHHSFIQSLKGAIQNITDQY